MLYNFQIMVHNVSVCTPNRINTIFIKLLSRRIMKYRIQKQSIKYTYRRTIIKESIDELHAPLLMMSNQHIWNSNIWPLYMLINGWQNTIIITELRMVPNWYAFSYTYASLEAYSNHIFHTRNTTLNIVRVVAYISSIIIKLRKVFSSE